MKSKRLLRVRVWLGISFLIVSNLTQLADSNPKSGKAPTSEWLAEASWLNEHLKSQELILVDTRSRQEYSVGHIPRAVWLDLSDLPTKTSESGLQALGQELAKKFALLGITGTEKIVFYEEHTGTRAPRALWFLSYSGYSNGKVLHGGISGWREAGYPLSSELAVRPPRPFKVRENSEILASADYVSRRIRNPGCVLLDVRSQEEYSGLDSSRQDSRTGHIPGATWLEWKELLDGMMNFKSVAELQKRLFDAGVTPDKEIIAYCQSGSRSSNTYLALRILGYPRLKNYIGSWQEWSSRLDLPIEKMKEEASPNP